MTSFLNTVSPGSEKGSLLVANSGRLLIDNKGNSEKLQDFTDVLDDVIDIEQFAPLATVDDKLPTSSQILPLIDSLTSKRQYNNRLVENTPLELKVENIPLELKKDDVGLLNASNLITESNDFEKLAYFAPNKIPNRFNIASFSENNKVFVANDLSNQADNIDKDSNALNNVPLKNNATKYSDMLMELLNPNNQVHSNLSPLNIKSIFFDKETQNKPNVSITSMDSDSLLFSSNSSLVSISDVKPGLRLGLLNGVANSQWATEFGERVRWLISNNIHKAEIRLNPANLGVIEINISINSDVTNINLIAHNAMTKEMLEESLAQLKSELDESEKNQVNVHVSDNRNKNESQEGNAFDNNEPENYFESEVSLQLVSSSNNLLDLYA